jgi:hypothetical protein
VGVGTWIFIAVASSVAYSVLNLAMGFKTTIVLAFFGWQLDGQSLFLPSYFRII